MSSSELSSYRWLSFRAITHRKVSSDAMLEHNMCQTTVPERLMEHRILNLVVYQSVEVIGFEKERGLSPELFRSSQFAGDCKICTFRY
jgi:hypothetical protein